MVVLAALALLTGYAGMSQGSPGRGDIREATVRMHMVDVDPATGALAYDQSFRDEETGAPGVDFNRRSWPNNPDAGFYKPHAMVWVCPPGVCPG